MSSPEGCTGKMCDYAVDMAREEILCETGVGNCVQAHLLEAQESKFHDSALSEASSKINEILASIPEDGEGRQLNFLLTPAGLLLSWVRHGLVSRHDGPASLTKALGVKS